MLILKQKTHHNQLKDNMSEQIFGLIKSRQQEEVFDRKVDRQAQKKTRMESTPVF